MKARAGPPPRESSCNYAERLIGQKLAQKFNPRNFYPALLDLNQLILDLPHRVREIVDLTAAGRLSFGIQLTQPRSFSRGCTRLPIGYMVAAIAARCDHKMRSAGR